MESYLLLDKERKLEGQLSNFASAAEHLLGYVPLDELSLVLRVRFAFGNCWTTVHHWYLRRGTRCTTPVADCSFACYR